MNYLYSVVNPELGSYFLTMFLFFDTSTTLVYKPDDKDIINDLGEENASNAYWGVSQLAQSFRGNITLSSNYDVTANSKSIALALLHSSIPDKSQVVFRLASTVVLETYALDFAITEQPYFTQYTSTKEVQKVMDNCGIVADWLGDHEEFYSFIPRFRQLYTGLGYLRNQLSTVYWGDHEV